MKRKKKLLYSGLGMLFIAFIVKWVGAPLYCFWVLLGIAITLKTLFLISVFREKGFKPSLWLYLILAGIALMLLSLLFKNIFPIPILQKTLFYSAIILKITGLVMVLLSQRKKYT